MKLLYVKFNLPSENRVCYRLCVCCQSSYKLVQHVGLIQTLSWIRVSTFGLTFQLSQASLRFFSFFFFAFKNILFLFVDPFSQDPNFSKFQNFFFYFRLFVVLSFNEFEGKNWFRPNQNHFLLFFSAWQIVGFPKPLGGKIPTV